MPNTKRELRREFGARLRQVSPETVRTESARVVGCLRGLPCIGAAAALAVFAALPGELDLGELADAVLASARAVYYPRYRPTARAYELALVRSRAADLVPGWYGIPEPRDVLPALTGSVGDGLVWLVPGLAFDPAGHRLGRGAGWYDRLLGRYPGCRVGVAYDWQVVAALPAEPHDRPMDMVVTGTRCWLAADARSS